MVFKDLTSGRAICYVKHRIDKSDVTGYRNVTYDANDPITKQWGRAETYSGKWLENLTQAAARDCLAVAMTRLDTWKLDICGHVHDEVIIEVGEDVAERSLTFAEKIFATPISWAPGLPLCGDGFISPFYRKDA